MKQNYSFNHWLYLVGTMVALLLGQAPVARAQLYYVLGDGNLATTADQLRRVNLDGSNNVLIKENFIQSPGTTVLDAANNRILVANLAVTNADNPDRTRIIAVGLGTGNPVSTLVTAGLLPGATTTQITGMALDAANGYLYYVLGDGNLATTADQLRRVNLDGSNNVLIKESFIQSPGTTVLDAANNRILVANLAVTNADNPDRTRIVAVGLGTGNPVSTLVTAGLLPGATTTQITGMALDAANGYLYYVLGDGNLATTADQLRRVNLDGSNNVLIKENFIQSPGTTVLDAANNRILVANLAVTNADNPDRTRIVAVGLGTGNPVSTLVTAGLLPGATTTQITGMAILDQTSPTVATTAPSGITTTGAVLGGSVSADGGAEVTERGVVYSATNTAPIIGGSNVTKDINGLGTGTFAKSIAGLVTGTTYYVRAYATNRIGTSYGSVVSFTTLPSAPVLNAPTNGALLTTRRPTFSGTAQTGSTVTVFLNGASIGTTTANGGTFSFAPVTNLADNAYSAYVTATVNNSTSAQSASVSFTVDATAPTVTSFVTTAGASGGTTTIAPFAFSVSFSESVTGLSASGISVTNGTVTGGPTGSGSGPYSFEVTPTTPNLVTTVRILANAAQDAAGNGNLAPGTYSLTYQIVIALAPASLPNGTVGAAYSQTITASGGTGPYSYSLASGTLPPGLTLSAGGNLSGTPTGGGIYSFTVTARDASTGSGPYIGSQAYTLTTNAPTLSTGPSVLADGIVSKAYSQTLTASGGTSPYAFDLAAGVLPPGTRLTSAGLILGTPTARGSFSFTIRVSDSSTGSGPYTSQRTYTVIIAAPTITLAPTTLATGAVQRPYSQTLTASGGTEPYTYALTAGSLPPGLVLSSGGNLSGTPTERGTYTFTLTATDAGGFTGSRAYTLTITAPTITGLEASPAVVCIGSPVTITASIGQVTAPYDYSLTVGSAVLTGTTSGPFSQTALPTGLGRVAISLVVSQNGQTSATTSVTVNALPTVSLTSSGPITCTQPMVSLTATGDGQGQALTYRFSANASQQGGSSGNTATVTTAGNYSVTAITTSGCSATAQTTIINSATLATPTLLTQSGQSAVTVDLNTTPVTLLVGGCSGTASWTGSNGTSGAGSTITVPTSQPGQFVYRATCQVGTCVSNPASATVMVGGRLTVLHRDVDNYADNNAIQPLLQIQNQGTGSLALSRLTLRYYLTVENGGTLNNLSLNYAQVGNQNVRLRYVPLTPAQQGATGYVEYSFTDGAGSLAAGANSGPIQGYFTKSDYGPLFEPDDYSYNPARDQLTGNLRITAYYDNVLIAGIEPGSTAQIRAVRALTESKNGPDATQINTYLEVRNEGNVAINYSDLKARYYFTSDGNERLQVEVDEGNVSARLVKLPQAVNGADTYLELTFNQGGQLAPGASTGTIRYRISKPDGGRFNQANDYSYQEQPQDRSQNSRVVVIAGNQVVWGTLPSGAAARLAYEEAGRALSVKVLGNPIQNDQVSFEVKGAQGQLLQLQLLTPQGRVISQQRVPSGEATQRHQLSVAGQAGGLFLLQVSTPTQSQTVKVIRSN